MKGEEITSNLVNSHNLNDLCRLFNASNRVLPLPNSIIWENYPKSEELNAYSYKPFTFIQKERDGTLADVEVANEDSDTNLYNVQSEINVINIKTELKQSLCPFYYHDLEFLNNHIRDICNVIDDEFSCWINNQNENSWVKLVDEDYNFDEAYQSLWINAGKLNLAKLSVNLKKLELKTIQSQPCFTKNDFRSESA